MNGFKDDLNERLDAAAKAKQAMLEKFRARQRPAAPAAAAAAEAAAQQPAADGTGEVGGKAPRKADK
jgi:Family of unknown function (DUF6481)